MHCKSIYVPLVGRNRVCSTAVQSLEVIFIDFKNQVLGHNHVEWDQALFLGEDPSNRVAKLSAAKRQWA